jgi:glycosyltransferase involved in cell wall biosynthesis
MMTGSDPIALAYVSLAVPTTPEFRNPALHNNGNTFMHNVLLGLTSDPLTRVEVFSGIPVPSFPRSRRLIVRKQRVELVPGVVATCVPFLNLTPLKQISMGLSVLWHLLRWGLRTRHTKNRIVFSFNISVPPLVFTLAAARLLRAKTVVYICDVNMPGQTVPGSLLYRIDAWLETHLLRYVEGLIVITDRIAADYAPQRPYVRVDGGVSGSLIQETGLLLATRKPDPLHFTIVATGSLTPVNGFHEILQAFSELKGPQYRLIVAGRGPLESEIAAAANRDMRIEFKGFLTYRELQALHATADVLISMRITGKINSAYAFPSKTFEYLVSGVPVITTATGHMKSEYGRFCFVLDEESPEALANALRTIERMAASHRDSIGFAARQFIVDCKAWEVQHKRIAEYLRSVVAVRDGTDRHQAHRRST